MADKTVSNSLRMIQKVRQKALKQLTQSIEDEVALRVSGSAIVSGGPTKVAETAQSPTETPIIQEFVLSELSAGPRTSAQLLKKAHKLGLVSSGKKLGRVVHFTLIGLSRGKRVSLAKGKWHLVPKDEGLHLAA